MRVSHIPLRVVVGSFSLLRMLLRLSAGALMLAFCLALAGCNPNSERQSAEQDNSHFKAGREKREALDYKGAIEAFEHALEDNPRSVLAHFELGVLYEQHEADYAAALYHYNRVLKLRPSGYPSDNVRQRIPACKQEMVKADSLAVMNPAVLKETERLREDNQKLQREIASLQAKLSGRPTPVFSTNAPVQLPVPARAQTGSPAPTQAANSAPRVGTGSSAPAGASQNAPTRLGSPSRVTSLPPRTDGVSRVRMHTVKSGDTMASIGRRYGVSQGTLLAANPGIDPRRLRVGQIVSVP
jgi:LysM repeat protein